jgi:hypothetical protein
MKKENFVTPGLRNMGGRTGRISSPKFEDLSTSGVSMMAKRLH